MVTGENAKISYSIPLFLFQHLTPLNFRGFSSLPRLLNSLITRTTHPSGGWSLKATARWNPATPKEIRCGSLLMYNMSVCYRNHLKSGVALHVRKLQFVIVPPCMLGVRRSLSNESWQPVGCCCIASVSKISPAVQFALTRYVMDREECANTFGWGKYGKMNRFSSTVPVIVATLFDVAVYLDMDN